MAAASSTGGGLSDELSRILAVAVEAAKGAGALIRVGAGRTEVEKSKATDIDLVTEVDKNCQNLIEKAITDNFPSHKILGEESVEPGAAASTAACDALADSDWLWVIDPLDGTTNFVHGLPLSVVSIGIANKGVVVVGVVYEPYRDELFTAVRGRGAFLNGTPIRVATETAIGRSLFGFGFHHTPWVCKTMVRGVDAVTAISRGCRSLGSAALHLSYTACGRLTGFWELDLSSWDIAAGSLLVQEAGGRVTDTRGADYTLRTRDVFASNGAEGVHGAVLAALAGVGAHKPDPKPTA